MDSDSDDDLFLTQSTFRESSDGDSDAEFIKSCYCPIVENISDDEHDSQWADNVQNVLETAKHLNVTFEDVENAVTNATDLREMASDCGASFASAYRPLRSSGKQINKRNIKG